MWETEAEAVLAVCTRAVIYVPVVFRSSAIVLLFVLCWAINVYGFDRAHLPFRRVMNLPQASAQFRYRWVGLSVR